jgi:hypothetical protein
MAPRNVTQLLSNEADIQLAISSIESSQIQKNQHGATIYHVPKSTLHDRGAGRPARCDCQLNSKRLTQQEEEAIVTYILDLDRCGFAPTYATVRDMANKLLAARSAGHVGVHWPRNFVKCQR